LLQKSFGAKSTNCKKVLTNFQGVMTS